MWTAADFSLEIPGSGARRDIAELARWAYVRAGRTDFRQPGFCLINLGADASSEALRRLMVDLMREMRGIHRSATRSDLVCLSAARFDQQVSTKAHRDGGPDECILILGYEPSDVQAELALADYAKCAFEMGLTPAEFLEGHNPMFRSGEQLLHSYTTTLEGFSNRCYQIVLINNSVAPYSPDRPAWQGVLHTASIRNPSDALRRVVNSMMIGSLPIGIPEEVPESQQEEFVTTRVVRRRGYDKLNLKDDR